MTGLFNSFDSHSFLNLFVWSVLFLFLFTSISKFSISNRCFISFISMKTFILKIFEELNQSKNFSGFMLSFFNLFLFIYFLNFISLTGYIFSPTSHLTLNLSMGFIFWTMSIFMLVFNLPFKLLEHLVPTNSPLALIFFLILIETLSTLMRPFVLAIRLTANLFAGHLLMSLIASMKISSLFYFLITSLSQFLFLMLEIMVSVIQAYIFSLLLMSYLSEMIN